MNLLNIIDHFPQKRIVVWGDIILDEYVFGNTRRISREAPVLILSYNHTRLSLGGAGNAILNLKAIGAEPIPIGVIGKDYAGDEVIRILESHKISTRFLIREEGFSTPQKTRILAGEENTRKQQILRIDREGIIPDTKQVCEGITKNLKTLLPQANALLISDYNYKTVKLDIYSRILPEYRNADLPVTLDSRFRLFSFPGVTVSTPNEPEVEAVTGCNLQNLPEELEAVGKRLLDGTQSKAVLMTRGSRGMALFEAGRKPELIPVHGSTHIVDVTGAGDTVISVFTLALTAGASFSQAAILANHAGGIVVMKEGTASVTADELKGSIKH